MATRRGPDNSIRVAVTGTQGSTSWAMVFWAQLTVSGSPTQTDIDNWVTAFDAAPLASFVGLMNNTAQATGIAATFFQPGGTVIQSVKSIARTGANAATAVQNAAVCRVISWTTNVYWRGGKPRSYLPTVSVADVVSESQLSAGARTTLASGANGARGQVNALTTGAITGTSMGFVSFRSGNVDRPAPLFFPFSGARAHARLGTQRRRLGHWVN